MPNLNMCMYVRSYIQIFLLLKNPNVQSWNFFVHLLKNRKEVLEAIFEERDDLKLFKILFLGE